MIWVVLILVGIIILIILYYYFNDFTKKALWAKKQERKAREKMIMKMFDEHDKIRNNDVERLLDISDAMATNYLDKIEKDGLIQQIGERGRDVYYIKKANIRKLAV